MKFQRWMTQIYDEDWLENMINEFGGFRRGNGFDYFAGGFLWIVPPSQDRFQMTEDTRYVDRSRVKGCCCISMC